MADGNSSSSSSSSKRVYDSVEVQQRQVLERKDCHSE